MTRVHNKPRPIVWGGVGNSRRLGEIKSVGHLPTEAQPWASAIIEAQCKAGAVQDFVSRAESGIAKFYVGERRRTTWEAHGVDRHLEAAWRALAVARCELEGAVKELEALVLQISIR